MTQTQTAFALTELRKPLSKITRAIPEPKEGQVQIKVTVAGLNPHDAKSRDYGLFVKDQLPAILAGDVVGIVTRVGQSVTRYKLGDHVCGQSAFPLPMPGFSGDNYDTFGLQEYSILDEKFSAKVPVGFTDAQMATFPINYVTAAVALFDSSTLGIPAPWDATSSSFNYKDTSILIIGGGANTGKFGIQLASLVGIGKIVVVSSLKSEAEARSYGATHVIDRTKSGAEIAAEVRGIVGDDLVYVYDTINALENQWVGVEALSNSKTGKLARLIPHGTIDESKLSTPKTAGYELRNVLGVSYARPDVAVPLWRHISDWVQQGKLKPLPYETIKGLDLDAVNETIEGYSNGNLTGQWQVHH